MSESTVGALSLLGTAWLVAFLVLSVTKSASSGGLDRNALVGIRLLSTMASDEAWRVGHEAAIPTLRWMPLLAGAGTVAVIALAVWSDEPMAAFFAALGVVVLELAVLIVAAVQASRAARDSGVD